MIVVAVVAVLVIIVLVRRGSQPSPLEAIINIPDDDPDMAAAIRKAQETLPTFAQMLAAPPSGKRFLLIKARFVDGTASEHMWVADLVADGDGFRGVLGDEPNAVKNLRFKQPVTITRDQITDWMAVEDGKVKGAFTTRVLRSKMTPDQQKAFDRSMPYALE